MKRNMDTSNYSIKEITADVLSSIYPDLADAFWLKVKEIDWPSKADDIDAVRATMTDNEKKLYGTIARLYRQVLVFNIKAQGAEKFGQTYKYVEGVSDDGFWDLTAHIVGLGKKTYDDVLKNVANIRHYLDTYRENFEYNFSID